MSKRIRLTDKQKAQLDKIALTGNTRLTGVAFKRTFGESVQDENGMATPLAEVAYRYYNKKRRALYE